MKLLQVALLLLNICHVFLHPDREMRNFFDSNPIRNAQLRFTPSINQHITGPTTKLKGGIIDLTAIRMQFETKASGVLEVKKIGPDRLTPAVGAWYLPYSRNRSVLMRLVHHAANSDSGENWFFTAPLGGCEVWIAHHGKNDQPVVMHINGVDGDRCDPRRMETLADSSLKYIQRAYDQNYQFVHRITRSSKEIETHLTAQFCNSPKYRGIKVSTYSTRTGHAIFYGEYNGPTDDRNSAQYGGWTFKVRGQNAIPYTRMMFFTAYKPSFFPLSADFCQSPPPEPQGALLLTHGLNEIERKVSGNSIRKRDVTEDLFCTYFNDTITGFIQQRKLRRTNRGSAEIISGRARKGRSTVGLAELFPDSVNLGSLLNHVELRNISYNCNSTELTFSTRRLKSATLIPGILELEDAAMSVVATMSPISVIRFTIFADWEIGSIRGDFSITDDVGTKQYIVSGSPSSDTIINIQSSIQELTGQSVPLPTGMVNFSDIVVFGSVDTFTNGKATFDISGKSGDSTVRVIVQKGAHLGTGKSSTKYAGAFAGEFSSFVFSDLIHDLTGVDDSEIPFLGSIVVPNMAVTVATGHINLVDQFENTTLLSFAGYRIQKGVAAYFRFTALNDVPVKMSYSKKIFSFQVLNGESIKVSDLISQIPGLSLDSLALPPGIDDILSIKVAFFSVNTRTQVIKIAAQYPSTLSYFDGILTVEDPAIVAQASLKSPFTTVLQITGQMNIGGDEYEISITQDSNSKKYILIANIQRIDISKIVETFGTTVFPDEFSSLIDGAGFLRFAIDDAKFSYPLSGKPQQIAVAGNPTIAGLNSKINAIVVRQGRRTELVEGFEIGNTNIADLIHRISGQSVGGIEILNQESSSVVVISPVTLPNVRLIGSQFSSISIYRGISFQASMQWPPGCSSDAFCAVAQWAIGEDAMFTLQGTIENAHSFALAAAVTDLQLGSITMSEAGLEISVGQQIAAGIFGTVTLDSPALTFTGAISVGTQGVVLEMTMSGCWEQAFGADWLSICSLQAQVSLKPGVPLAGFAFGGRVKLGDPVCGNQVEAVGFIGIDPLSPQENYYYVNVPGEFTFQSILQAFCVSSSVPRPIAELGFPNGFLSSFSQFGKELPHVPLSIPQGYQLNGTISFLGLTAEADVTIGLPSGIQMDVLLPSLDLANGLMKVYSSRKDRSSGPYLVANITILPQPIVKVQGSGYVSVLGMSTEAAMFISDTVYEWKIRGKYLGLFDTSLTIGAFYGDYADILSASFKVEGRFHNDLFDSIEKQVENALQVAADEATSAINSAQDNVDREKAKFDAANKDLQKAQRKVDRADEAFDDAKDELRDVKRELNKVCTPPTCHDVCIPGTCKTTCCGTVWGTCVCYEPEWDSCCTRSPDAVCETERESCIALRKTLKASLKAAEVIVDESRHSLDVANAALDGAKATVDAAKLSLDVAKGALELAKQLYAVGSQAADYIAQFTLGGVVDIESLTFDVELSVANGGSFEGTLKARVTGKEVTEKIQVDLRDVISMAKEIAELAISGISSYF